MTTAPLPPELPGVATTVAPQAPSAQQAPQAPPTTTGALAHLLPAPPNGTPAAPRAGKRKRKPHADTARQYRQLHFSGVKDEDLWDRARGGWASLPRPVGLIANLVIKEAHKTKYRTSSAAGTTYTTLWLHYQDHGMARIESETDAALESGYGGERGITTFRRHLRTLKELGFIDYVEETRGRVKWVLLHNPYKVVKQLHADGLIERQTYSTTLERAAAVGAGGEFDDEAEGDHGAE